jgi:hypothetical protein
VGSRSRIGKAWDGVQDGATSKLRGKGVFGRQAKITEGAGRVNRELRLTRERHSPRILLQESHGFGAVAFFLP